MVGYVMRRDEANVGKSVMVLEVVDTRGRGRPKRRWMDNVKEDLRKTGLVGDEFEDREGWHSLVRNADLV